MPPSDHSIRNCTHAPHLVHASACVTNNFGDFGLVTTISYRFWSLAVLVDLVRLYVQDRMQLGVFRSIGCSGHGQYVGDRLESSLVSISTQKSGLTTMKSNKKKMDNI